MRLTAPMTCGRTDAMDTSVECVLLRLTDMTRSWKRLRTWRFNRNNCRSVKSNDRLHHEGIGGGDQGKRERELPQQQQRLPAYRVEFVEVKFLRLVTVSETNFNIDLAAR